MRHGNPHFDPRIKAARRKAAAAESNLRRITRKVQEECDHPVVAHLDGRLSEYFGPSPSWRICVRCGLEEKVRYGTTTSWRGPREDPCGEALSYEEAYAPLKLSGKPLIVCREVSEIRRHKPHD